MASQVHPYKEGGGEQKNVLAMENRGGGATSVEVEVPVVLTWGT